MTHRQPEVLVTLVLFLLTAVPAAFALPYTAPTINRNGQVGLIQSHSAKTVGMGRLNVGLSGNLSFDRGYVRAVLDPDTNRSGASDTLMAGDTLFDPSVVLFNLYPAIGYGITRFLDLSVMLPIYLERLGEYQDAAGADFGGSASGVGDMQIALKFQYPPYPHRRFFEMAYYGQLSLPTGDQGRKYFPRHTYYLLKGLPDDSSDVVGMYSSGLAEFDMKMLWTFDFGQLRNASPVATHINYGVRWTRSELDHLFLLNIAFEYYPLEWLTLFTEFTGETRVRNIDRGFKIGDDPLRLSPGVSIRPPGGFYLTLGVDISLASDTAVAYNALDSRIPARRLVTRIEPQYRLAGAIGWAGFILPQDADQDGVKDNVDKCPREPEDIDGFEDEDGCPDTDNDRDGIVDLKDKCINDPEDADGFEDEDGCPEPDNDKDLVADTDDQCPLIPEDLDGFEDADGCPDPDNDNDRIEDVSDSCFMVPEDYDGFEDADGCPEYDNDIDGIPDSVDNCPQVRGVAEYQGCPPPEKPKAKEIKRGRVVLRGVNFETGSATLTRESYETLDRVYESLMEWPEVKIRIVGHTDNIGSRLYNKRLSMKRAESVEKYLLSRGIGEGRLTAEGRGEEEPLAPNTSAEGRRLNRRVELNRFD